MDDEDNNKKWFTNIEKSDTGVNIDIIPSDRVLLRASSSHTNHNVRNVTDSNPDTKWTSNYSIQTYKDDLYTNRQITVGDYSRGEIVKDGKNRKLLNDNQQYKDSLRNKINSFRNAINQTTSYQNSLKKKMKTKHPSEFQRTIYTSAYIGNSGKRAKSVYVDNLVWVQNSIVNRYGDKFFVYIEKPNHIRVLRTDWDGGWGDTGLTVPVRRNVQDTAAYNRWYSNEWWTVYNHNKEIDRIINFSTKYYNSLINKAQNELNDTPDVNINELPVSITNDGKYIGIKNDGKYTGNKQTILANNSTIKGEWIEVEIPETVVVKKYEMLPGKRDGTNELTPFPKDFYVLGANDTNKWEILDSHFDYKPVYDTDNSPISFNINNKKKYKYLRLVISSLNPANIGFHGLGSASLSIFNVSGNRCYTLNKSCETFQSYSNKKNTMSKIEGLTMMDTSMEVLADLKEFNKTYQKYVKCTDTTIPDSIKSDCTDADKDIQTVNNVYNTLTSSLSKLKEAPLNKFIDRDAYETNHNKILQTHSEIIPLRKELDSKMKFLMDEDNIYTDYKEEYDTTMYYSLVLSVVLTSSLFFIFKKL